MPGDAAPQPDKRKHHFVPAFILSGFSERADGRLYVHDRRRVRAPWLQLPREVAHERDMYRVDGPDPLLVENGLGKVEALAAPIIRRMSETQDLPTGTDYDILMNLLACMAARVPRRRDQLAKFLEGIARMSLQMTVGNPRAYESAMKALRAKDPSLPDVSREKMVEFVGGPNLELQADRSWLVKSMLDAAGTLVDLLGNRKWTLLIAKRDEAGFICSDHPVTLVPTRPFPPPFSPGWGMPSTVVHAPLTRRMALLGSFERPSDILMVSTRVVAEVNRWTALYADRFMYSPSADFIWGHGTKLMHASEFHEPLVDRALSLGPNPA